MKFLIAAAVLAAVLIAGCSQLSAISCKSNWTIGSQTYVGDKSFTNESCRSQCYAKDNVTTYKIENLTRTIQVYPHAMRAPPVNVTPFTANVTSVVCYCDTNNCKP